MFPTFPNFVELQLDQKGHYDEFYKRFEPYSDFSFGNLMIWLNQYGDLHISLLNGNVIIECHNLFEDGKYTLTLLGDTNIDQTLDDLFTYQKATNNEASLVLVPEVVVTGIKHRDRYAITEEPANSNYILSCEKLSSLPGADFERIKRQIKSFVKDYGDRCEVVELDITKTGEVNKLVNDIHVWDTIYTHNDQEKQESFVINTSLQQAAELDFRNISLVIDGSIQAIAIYQLLPQPEYVICNHMKVNFNYRHASVYLTHQLASRLWRLGIPYLNFEQDLGIEGLREHKRRMRPVKFLKSYQIQPARG